MQTIMFRMHKQHYFAICHKELYPISWDKPQWKRILKKKRMYVCKTELLFCTAEVDTVKELHFNLNNQDMKQEQKYQILPNFL